LSAVTTVLPRIETERIYVAQALGQGEYIPLQGIAFQAREELLAAIHEIVGSIPRPILGDVFQHSMERLEWVSQNNTDYYP
jgi:hypothetical protein